MADEVGKEHPTEMPIEHVEEVRRRGEKLYVPILRLLWHQTLLTARRSSENEDIAEKGVTEHVDLNKNTSAK